MQTIMPLADESAVKITTQHYYTRDKHDINVKRDEDGRIVSGVGGIVPNIEVDFTDKDFAVQREFVRREPRNKLAADRLDPQLDKAIETLAAKIVKRPSATKRKDYNPAMSTLDDSLLPPITEEEVRRCTYDAFANTVHPGDEAIWAIYNRSGRGADFLGKTWQEASVEIIQDSDDAIFYFEGDLFRYYLPAFILGTLDESLSEMMISVFIPPSCSTDSLYDGWSRFKWRFDGLTKQQCACIAIFMDWAHYEFSEPYEEELACALTFWKNPYDHLITRL